MALPTNLANGDLITEGWVDSVTNSIAALDNATSATFLAAIKAALDSRYMPVVGPAWNTYAPAIVQGASTIAGTINNARWTRNGRMITAQVLFTATGAGSSSVQITISLPVPAFLPASGPATLAVGTMEFRDASTNLRYNGTAWLNSATTVAATVSGAADVTVGAAAIVNTNDSVNMCVTYEATT